MQVRDNRLGEAGSEQTAGMQAMEGAPGTGLRGNPAGESPHTGLHGNPAGESPGFGAHRNMGGVEDAIPASEAELVAKARTGDPDAFGELVRRHRARAFGIARSLTQDPHLAEDVVQDALVRAFLHLGTLVDAARFSSWLSKIIRNEAYMKLRRGGPHGKERPFTSFEGGGLASQGSSGGSSSGVTTMREDDWHDIDRVLFHLSRSALDSARQAYDPSAALLRKELIDGIRSLLHCLSPREKRIFEAYFFEQLPPQDIAALLDTAVANVYNSISRARSKMQQERIRVHISMYVQQRQKLGKPAKKLLAPPSFKPLWKD
jgi:RNA polymerase sigma factor (sigma-70 family)